MLPSAYGVHQALCRLQGYAAYHRLSSESGPLGGKQTHNPEISNVGPYHYASGMCDPYDT
jgi:hypothetical protein